jgi:sn-glycerol 3-phosphate transport system substrate-binding protein
MRKAIVLLLALAVLLGLASGPLWAAPIEISWWHAMTGVNGERINKFSADFNASQTKYHVTATYKGTYTEAMNAVIAAFRANQQPEIVQVFEVGTQSMMMSGAIYPVYQLMTDTGHNVDWSGFIQPVLSYYFTTDNHLLSLPFNSSTPILYYNIDAFTKAGLKGPPKTWQQMDEYVNKLTASGQKCAYTTSWQTWVHLENYTALHGLWFATEDNGFKSLDAKLEFNNPVVVKHFELLQRWVKEGAMSYEGRGATPDPAFSSGKCAMQTGSSANFGNYTRDSKFKWAAAPLPIETGYPIRNSTIGGATLWVLKGHSQAENEGTAAFLNYLASVPVQVFWHEATGYVPITLAAYDQAKKDGYYKANPVQEIAIEQLTRVKPTPVSRGLRLGNLVQIRDVMDEESENIWSGKKTAQQGLDDMVRRGNELLRQFQQMQKQ